MNKLTDKQILKLRGLAQIIVECLPEDTPIRGNAMASGDEAEDKRVEDMIIEQLESGNEWAWCCVRVTLKYHEHEGVAYLGACSYKSMSDFKECDYFVNMVSEAFDDLVRLINYTIEDLKGLSDL